jgi:hypothetical protein
MPSFEPCRGGVCRRFRAFAFDDHQGVLGREEDVGARRTFEDPPSAVAGRAQRVEALQHRLWVSFRQMLSMAGFELAAGCQNAHVADQP